MATSGSTNFNITAREVITFALEEINVLGAGASLQPEDTAKAMSRLNYMLKSWMKYPGLWRKSTGELILRSPSISGITQADPAVVTTSAAHNLNNGDRLTFASIGGMTEMNGRFAWVANKTSTTFEASGIDSSAFTSYTSGGVVRPTGYRLPSTNPFRLIEPRFRQVISSDLARDIPMDNLTWSEYHELPVKASTGSTTQYHFNPGRGDLASDGMSDPILYVWPIIASVSGETVEYTYQRRFEDVDTPDDNLDIAAEWFDAAGYGLAKRLMSVYGKGANTPSGALTVAMAQESLEEARDSDRDDIVVMEPEYRYG